MSLLQLFHWCSLIRMANDTAADILGYGSKSRMIGHNVNVIVPPPFSKVSNLLDTSTTVLLSALPHKHGIGIAQVSTCNVSHLQERR
jgi:hypothetical protein